MVGGEKEKKKKPNEPLELECLVGKVTLIHLGVCCQRHI